MIAMPLLPNSKAISVPQPKKVYQLTYATCMLTITKTYA